jgi:uncharacterized protein (DUF305 family)
MNTRIKPRAAVVALVAAFVLALVVTGCGSSKTNAPAGSGTANKTDSAFVTDMVPHHRSAIEMATVAEKKADHPHVRQLASNIISAQKAEIATLDGISASLHHSGVSGGHMGMSDKAMGMSGDTAMLSSAKPFDREFIDMMIPHHQGAIRMARSELATGRDPRLRKIARGIIAAQSREIAQMRSWRKQWYGSSKVGGSSTMNGN